MINIGILEDEKEASDVLASFIERYSIEKNLPCSVDTFTDAETFLKSYKPRFDILLMDIQLPGKNGIDASKQVRKIDPNVIIIFVTNMAQFAVNGYEVNALDFIIKPISYESFSMRMDKAVEKANNSKASSLPIVTDRNIVILQLKDIFYIDVRDHEVVFHLLHEEYKSRGSLSNYVEKLDGKGFCPCSSYCLANLANVVSVVHDEVVFPKGSAHISRMKKRDFLMALSNYLGRN
jgi:DNA-binding LytR/AlgR family response regulator